jgi:DNA-binding MarR family transcriptional regulator
MVCGKGKVRDMRTEAFTTDAAVTVKERPTMPITEPTPPRGGRGRNDFLWRFFNAHQPFVDIRGTMPLQYVRAFLLVAMDEGKGVSTYAQRAGVSNSVMSRHLLDIGERNRYMEEGFGLVFSKPNPSNLRESCIYLTPKGKTVVEQIIFHLEAK